MVTEAFARPAPFSVRNTPGSALVKAWDHGVPMEADVWKQVDNLAAVPGVERVAIMPDAHIGHGACVGSAILTRDIVIPAAVHLEAMVGVECRPDRDILDESPAAYKDIDSVMAAQSDLTEPIHTLKQIVVVKG